MATKYVQQTKYYRIKEAIKSKILDGELKPGDRVMSEAEICQHYGVSRISAKRALDELMWEGHVRRISGSGSYVTYNEAGRSQRSLSGLSAEVRRRGMSPSSKLVDFRELSVSETPCPAKLQGKLHLAASDRLYQMVRLRYANGEVIALDDVYLPVRLYPDLSPQDLADPAASFYALLEHRYGRRPDHAVETCFACTIGLKQSKLLGMEVGMPALKVERFTYAAGQAVEFCTRVFRSGVYDYRVDLQ